MKPQISRCVLFCVLVLAIFGAMFARLGSMQIQQQEDYVARAESRSTKTIIETGKRVEAQFTEFLASLIAAI